MKLQHYLALSVLATILSACPPPGSRVPKPRLEYVINENISFPTESYSAELADFEVDESISIDSDSGSEVIRGIQLEIQSNNTVKFIAPQGNIAGVAIRFGESSLINVLPVSELTGQTSGTLGIPFTIAYETCDNIAQICYFIECYEYAITTDGKISKPNLRAMSIVCGSCDDSSCQDVTCN